MWSCACTARTRRSVEGGSEASGVCQGGPAAADFRAHCCEPTQVIIERERENRLFAELSRQGFAPPYLGRFTNGRIEGYLPARPLTPEEMGQTSPVDFVAYIARELARMHSMRIHGVCESEPLLWTLIDKWAGLASGRWDRTCFRGVGQDRALGLAMHHVMSGRGLDGG